MSVVRITKSPYYRFFFFFKKIYKNFVGTLETVPNRDVSVPTFSSAEAYSVTVMLALCFFSSLF